MRSFLFDRIQERLLVKLNGTLPAAGREDFLGSGRRERITPSEDPIVGSERGLTTDARLAIDPGAMLVRVGPSEPLHDQAGDSEMSKRVLVTGGAGFLGSHLCAVLLNQGCEVLCVDNFFTGTRGNVDELLDHRKFEILRHDVTLPLYVEVDEIYNLACPASPIHYQHDPVHTTKTSVMGAINALGLAKRLKARVLQASTSEVYGDPDVHPQPRATGAWSISWGCVPVTTKASAAPRRCSTIIAGSTIWTSGWPASSIPIGPKMHPQDGRVISNFIIQALKNEPITIYGDGSQTRSFCFVDDLIEGLVLLMNVPGDLASRSISAIRPRSPSNRPQKRSSR